jgi:hypothetical protein
MALTKTDKDFITLSIQGVNARITDMHENFGEKLEGIEKQTTKTNGRVGELETWKENQRIFCGEVQSAKKERMSAKERRQKVINLSLYCVITAIAVWGFIAKLKMPEVYASKEYEKQVLKEVTNQTAIIQNSYIKSKQDIINVIDSLNENYSFWKEMNATRDSNKKNNPIIQ